MPIINLDIGKLSQEQKRELITCLSVEAARITNIPLGAFTVVINELADDNIGIGGKTIGDLKEEAGRKI